MVIGCRCFFFLKFLYSPYYLTTSFFIPWHCSESWILTRILHSSTCNILVIRVGIGILQLQGYYIPIPTLITLTWAGTYKTANSYHICWKFAELTKYSWILEPWEVTLLSSPPFWGPAPPIWINLARWYEEELRNGCRCTLFFSCSRVKNLRRSVMKPTNPYSQSWQVRRLSRIFLMKWKK